MQAFGDFMFEKHLRTPVAAAYLLLPVAAALATLPTSVSAQQRNAIELRSLELSSDQDLQPGSRLRIKVIGTPRGQATVRIRGVRDTLVLREVEPGVYITRYTIKRDDRVDEDGQVRGAIRAGGRTAAASMTVAEASSSDRLPDRPAVAVLPPAAALRIERFALAPFGRMEPGADLRFELDGAAGASVVVDLPGVGNDLTLRETRPGHYEGVYTVRRADVIDGSRPVVATLRMGERAVTASIAMPGPAPVADNRTPTLSNLLPRPDEVVSGGANVQIAGNFDDRGGSGVDPSSVRIALSGRNITPDAQIDANSFRFQGNLPPGHYTVDVTARDRAGNTLRKDWSFDVAGVVPVNLPLQVTNHSNNGTVQGASTLIEGRTAPYATVAVSVEASAPIGGAVVGKQRVLSETVQADASGRFSFTFSPRFPIPGTRYEIDMSASKANVKNDTKLVLFQRQG
jgi:hypothetical protein